jgi:hypothetical protein
MQIPREHECHAQDVMSREDRLEDPPPPILATSSVYHQEEHVPQNSHHLETRRCVKQNVSEIML